MSPHDHEMQLCSLLPVTLKSLVLEPLRVWEPLGVWEPRQDLDLPLPMDWSPLTRLTSLSSLSLRSFKRWSNLDTIRRLPIVELSLLNCNHMEVDLFVPGSMQQLQTLMICDTYFEGEECTYSAATKNPELEGNYVPSLQQIARLVKSLPALQTLDANECTLFQVGLYGKHPKTQFLPIESKYEHIDFSRVR